MLKVSFKSYPDNLDLLINSKMRENYASIENEIVQKATDEVNDKFKSRFNRQISKLQTETGAKDIANILSAISKAYKDAGLNRDSDIIDSQIKKLNIVG